MDKNPIKEFEKNISEDSELKVEDFIIEEISSNPAALRQFEPSPIDD